MFDALASALDRLSLWANRLAEWTLAVVAMTMVSVIGLQVFFRYGLNNSLFWSEELGRLLLVWLTFLGASVAYRRGAHVGVDIFVARLSPGKQRVARVLVLLVSLFFFGFIAIYGFKFLHFVRFQSTTSLGVSKQVPFLMAPISGALASLHALAFLAGEFRGRR